MPCNRLAAEAAVVISLMAAGSIAAHAAPWRADEANTRGWMLMSPQERIDHQAKVRNFTSYEACETYRAEHHALMEQRARERGLSLPGRHWNFCDRLRRDARPGPD